MSVFHRLNPQWQQTMLRIASPEATLKFYKEHFGFTLLDELHFPKMKFSLYFMATLPGGVTYDLKPGTKEAHDYLWNFKGVTLEFTHNHVAEGEPVFKANNGNVEPNRGFGHIALLCDDVYKTSEELEAKGVGFQKRPDEGRMKGLAFCLDPDGYWIELVKRSEGHGLKTPYNLAQTMIRVKNGEESVAFYEKYFGMTLVYESHHPEAKFSNFFMAQLTPEMKAKLPPSGTPEQKAFLMSLHDPILELTFNHGTEKEEGPVYHNGNTDPKGFGHIGFLVDNVEEFCAALEADNIPFQKKLSDGSMNMIAFAKDPTGYWIEIIPRGMVIPETFFEQ
eukprot:TRINITY_DN8297_c0_g1_i1.p1 TRINITY_DN8297_c0_g1~~TRINITY_DN8297_c0_g1_i1.p1  ORF type:complete len:335 (+),score=101.53 TRINITY_DN8297_c0_g1_i1:61-1065(+)